MNADAQFGRRGTERGDAVTDDRPVLPAGLAWNEFERRLVQRVAPARVRLRQVAEYLNAHEPVGRTQLLASADAALAGQWILPGSEGRPVFIGDPPAWTTPRFGNEEYLWALNRMAHWKPLLRAHALTGEDRYARKVVTELDDWMARVHPAPPFHRADGSVDPESLSNSAPAPWRSLELGIRLFDTWTEVIEHLAGTAHLPPERLERMVRSMAVQAEGLSVVTPVIWPNADHNHYFMEMLGVLTVAALLPELPAATAWREQATRELVRCVKHQFTEDGSHVEGCPMYHDVCVVLLARFLMLAEASGAQLPNDFKELCRSAGWHSVHVLRPNGQTVPWGDSIPHSGHESAPLWSWRATGDLEPLRHVGLLIGSQRLHELCLEDIWAVKRPAEFFSRLAAPPESEAATVRFDRGNDQVMLRTAWTAEAASVFFACHTPLPPGSGHQHIDLGGFDFCAYGRVLMADPGPFTYRECDDRKIFKGAAYHSVLTLDGRDPFEYLSRWRYGPQREGRVTAVRHEAGLVQVDSFHRNYAPAICRRTLALVDERLLVVIDLVENLAAGDTRQIYFHLDSTRAAWRPEERVAVSSHGDVEMALYSSGELECAMLPGRISENWEVARPSTRVQLHDRGGEARRLHATVLVPWRANRAQPKISGLAIRLADASCSFNCDGQNYRVTMAGA